MKAAIIFLFLMWPALCAAQAGAPVPKPEVKVGDRWIYHHWDQLAQNLVKTYELRVTFADRNVIHTVVTRQDQRETDAMWTSEWNATQFVLSEGVVDPHTGFFKFPLQVGDRYKASFEVALPQRGSHRFRREQTVKVVGWEEVVVPAGKFRALRLEAEGSSQRLDTGGRSRGRARNTFWYAPEAKRWVKSIFETHSSKGSPSDLWVEELVLFNVQ